MLFASPKTVDDDLTVLDSLFIAAVNDSLASALNAKAAEVIHHDPYLAQRLYEQAAESDQAARDLQAIIHVKIAQAVASGRRTQMPIAEALKILAEM